MVFNEEGVEGKGRELVRSPRLMHRSRRIPLQRRPR